MAQMRFSIPKVRESLRLKYELGRKPILMGLPSPDQLGEPIRRNQALIWGSSGARILHPRSEHRGLSASRFAVDPVLHRRLHYGGPSG